VTEAICNAFAFLHARAPQQKSQLRAFLKHSPEGYRDFGHYLSRAAFSSGVEEVLGEVLHGSPPRHAVGLRGLFVDRGDPAIGPWLVPVHLVQEVNVPAICELITALGSVAITSQFERDLARLPKNVQRKWHDHVLPALQSDARLLPSFKRLHGDRDLFSTRVTNDVRAVLRSHGGDRWSAERIGHRSSIYEGI
jgi:hypothetical protein